MRLLTAGRWKPVTSQTKTVSQPERVTARTAFVNSDVLDCIQRGRRPNMTEKIHTIPTSMEEQVGVFRAYPLGLHTNVDIVVHRELEPLRALHGGFAWTICHGVMTPLVDRPLSVIEADLSPKMNGRAVGGKRPCRFARSLDAGSTRCGPSARGGQAARAWRRSLITGRYRLGLVTGVQSSRRGRDEYRDNEDANRRHQQARRNQREGRFDDRGADGISHP